ncbi:protein MAIN-LIKE 1-like [Camellia sinensis]|uniref:protein MAIN-LIKE 1-like n=1 Tax=Camellia sinensis TaxID=4442 RepID=UPI0010363D8F|nr:protein MAIN-LIKE 1-like [Camellia sinensis]
MVSGVSRKRPTASNRRRGRQTEPEPVEVNAPVEEDDHVDANNDNVDDDIGLEDDDVNNDIGVEADLIEDDVGVDNDNTEPVPGAPEDPSLLISFRNHVAAAVWKKKERGPLKCLNRSRKLAEWPSQTVQNVRWRHLVEQSGLSVLIDHTYRHGNRVAISTFVESLGVPVNDAFAELVQSRGQSVKLEWLRIRFHEVNDTDDANFIEYVARAYLLYLLGCTLFADKSGTRVPVAYLHMLTDIDAVSSYAWGAAALAFQYRQLGLASRAGVKQIAGYLKLLEAWIYEHFRLGRPHPNLSYSDEQPRVCRWSSRRDGGFTEDHSQTLREQLDMLHANEIEWDPYHLCRTHHPLHEVAYYTGCLKCFDIVEPYHPNRVLRQFGRVQTIPPEPLSPVRATRGSKPRQYRIMYQYHDTIWAQWKNHVLSINAHSVPVQQWPSECVRRYREWYARVSHRVVQNPTHHSQFDPRVQRPENDVTMDPEWCNDATFNVGAAIHRLGRDECVLHPDMLYETIGRMLQVLDGQSLGSTLTHTEPQVYYCKRRRMDRT